MKRMRRRVREDLNDQLVTRLAEHKGAMIQRIGLCLGAERLLSTTFASFSLRVTVYCPSSQMHENVEVYMPCLATPLVDASNAKAGS